MVCVVYVVPGSSRHILESDVLNFRSQVFIPQPLAPKPESDVLNFEGLDFIPRPGSLSASHSKHESDVLNFHFADLFPSQQAHTNPPLPHALKQAHEAA